MAAKNNNPKPVAAARAPAASSSPSPKERVPGNGVARGKLTQLDPGKLEQAEFVRTAYCATVPQGVRPEHLADPAFWAHHAAKLSPWAKIEVRAEDGSWYGEFIVLDCSRTWAKVHPVVGPVFLTTGDMSLTQAEGVSIDKDISEKAKGYKVEFTPTTRWRVVRVSDSAAVDSNRVTRDDAEKWLRAHIMHELGKGPHPNEVVPA